MSEAFIDQKAGDNATAWREHYRNTLTELQQQAIEDTISMNSMKGVDLPKSERANHIDIDIYKAVEVQVLI